MDIECRGCGAMVWNWGRYCYNCDPYQDERQRLAAADAKKKEEKEA